MESIDEAWRRAQDDKTRLTAPFTLVLRAGTAREGLDSDVVVDETTIWHHSPLLMDMAGCEKGRPLVLQDVSAATLHAVVRAWYHPSPPTWPAEQLPDILGFSHKFGMERVKGLVVQALAASPIANDVLVDLYRRALHCETIRQAALVKLCTGRRAGTVVRALGSEMLVEDAHLVVEHAQEHYCHDGGVCCGRSPSRRLTPPC